MIAVVPIALAGVAVLTTISVLGRVRETLHAAPINIQPPMVSALDLARERLDAGDITMEEFLELRRILGE